MMGSPRSTIRLCKDGLLLAPSSFSIGHHCTLQGAAILDLKDARVVPWEVLLAVLQKQNVNTLVRPKGWRGGGLPVPEGVLEGAQGTIASPTLPR